jgi:hypothetical protein
VAPTPSVITPNAPAPSGNQSVAGVNENQKIACADSVVTISGMNNTVVVTGHCKLIQVSGMDNIVTVESADAIDASGMDNKVTYHGGSPTITKSGFSNTVEQG